MVDSKRIAALHKQGGVYKPMSEIDPGTQDTLDTPTPAWLDREYPYVSPPGEQGTLRELDYLISLVPLRHQYATFIRAADEDMIGLFTLLCSELGVPCDPGTLTEKASEAAVLITKLKWLYNRPRPYQIAAKQGIDFLPLESKTAHTPAYPSGHSIQAHLLASHLGEIAPQHRKMFMDLAHKIAFSRVVAGYHWPSDLVFGKDIFRHMIMPLMPSSVRVAKTFTIDKGQPIYYGKYKNKKGLIDSFGKNDKGDVLINVEPVPNESGRKQPKEMKLFKIRPRKVEKDKKASVISSVVAKYKDKKEVPKSDGKGTTTVYEYGPRQIAKRDKEKAVRIEALRKKLGDLRKKARTDLTAKDPDTRLTALAVCLMDETYERVGNEKSAKEGHFGVTNWTVDHVTLSDKAATIKYTGKSGVKHEKKVTNSRAVAALRKAIKGKGKGDKVLCDGDECDILAKDVNAYLKPYEITAKDIRGLHANEEMKHHLKAQRKAGPSDLPKSRKEKDKILKAEFKAALELAAAAVGHEGSTLRSQYLVPSMESSYVHDGTVIDKLDKKARRASWMKAKRFFPGVRNPLFHATTGPRAANIALRGEGIKSNSGFSNFGLGNVDASISFSRDLNFLLKGGFGNVVFVLDRDELNRKFPVVPHAYHNWEDEYEERVFTDKIPASMIRGVIFRYKPLRFEFDEWESKVSYPVAYIDGREWGPRTATLSDSEKEDRESARLVRQSPKLKPPRKDKERGRVKDTDPDTDPDETQDRKDRSNNFKDASARVALRFLLGDPTIRLAANKRQRKKNEKNRKKNQPPAPKSAPKSAPKPAPKPTPKPTPKEQVPMFNTEADRVVMVSPATAEAESSKYKTPTEDQSKAHQEVNKAPGEAKPAPENAPAETKPTPAAPKAPTNKKPAKDPKAARKEVLEKIEVFGGSVRGLSDLPVSELMEISDLLENSEEEIADALLISSKRALIKQKEEVAVKVLDRVSDEKSQTPTASEIATAIINKRIKQMAEDPLLLDPSQPLGDRSLDPLSIPEGGEAKYRNQMADLSIEAMNSYVSMDSETRSAHRENLLGHIAELEANGNKDTDQYAASQAQMRGLQVASALGDGEDAKGINPVFQKMLQAAQSQGRLEDFARLNITGAATGDEDAQAEFRKVIDDADDEDLADMLPDDHPGRVFADALNNEEYTSTMTPESTDMLRRLTGDMIVGEVLFTDADLVQKGKTTGQIKKTRKTRTPSKQMSALSSFMEELEKKLGLKKGKKATLLPEGWDFAPWGAVL